MSRHVGTHLHANQMQAAAQPHCAAEFIPPVADGLAFPAAGNASTSSWLGIGSVLSTYKLRNHCGNDPVQVQSTMRDGKDSKVYHNSNSVARV